MSSERNILKQYYVEPNPAMAGFGSIVDQPAAVLGGQDDLICMDEHQSGSLFHHQASSDDHQGESHARGLALMILDSPSPMDIYVIGLFFFF